MRHGAFEHAELERTPFHLAVLPSLCPETHGFVLDEAQMLGLPALASDLGAYAERLGAGGRSFPRGDAGALARELDALVEDPARLAAMRAAVRPPAPFEEHFGRVLALYEEVLGEERRPLEDRFDVGRHLELPAAALRRPRAPCAGADRYGTRFIPHRSGGRWGMNLVRYRSVPIAKKR